MGNAAAFPEHLAEGNSTAQVHWCTARSPDVSLRGAKRRGNLAEHGRTTGKPSAKSQLPSRDCHVGLRPPRNDKLGGHCLFNIGPHFPPVQCRARLSPPLQHTNGNFPLPSRSSSTHNVINIFVLWKKHKNPRGNPKRSLIIPSRRDLTNAGKCDKIKAQRESGAFKNTDPVFGIARQDRFVADRLGTPAFAAGAPFFFRRSREENQNV